MIFLNRSNRNFHVFYYMYYGFKSEGTLRKYHLDGINEFRFLPVGDSDTEAEFYLNGYSKLKNYFHLWDLEVEELEFMYRTIAAVLLLGQIEFFGHPAAAKNPTMVNKVATLLAVDPPSLAKALTSGHVVIRGEAVDKEFDEAEACDARDALARGLYTRFVDWIINLLNVKLTFGRLV